ncbi:MAG: hypothetical protein KBT03_07555 [Bacteroidales bacterium]|nr:hypothetical protein [Candidatus Scybalousia scybalohippi]
MLVKLDNGLEVSVDKESFNDMRVLDLLSEGEENPLALPKLIKLVMAEDQKNKIYDFIKSENNGKIPVDKFALIFNELMEKIGSKEEDVKN